jgi:hypothetical protein
MTVISWRRRYASADGSSGAAVGTRAAGGRWCAGLELGSSWRRRSRSLSRSLLSRRGGVREREAFVTRERHGHPGLTGIVFASYSDSRMSPIKLMGDE